jgi:hypothetical protein
MLSCSVQGRKKCGLFSQKAAAKFLIASLPSLKKTVASHPPLMEGLSVSSKPTLTLDNKCVKHRIPPGIGQKRRTA